MSELRGIVCMLAGELVELRGGTWYGENEEMTDFLDVVFGPDCLPSLHYDPDPGLSRAREACRALAGRIVADHRPPPPEHDEEVIY